MDDNYASSLNFVLRWEGGFANVPGDAGGRTMKGVTQRVYDAWRARSGKPPGDVKNIVEDELAAIYSQNFWKAALCNALQSNIDMVQFDTAVNMGPVRAMKMLQQAVGVDPDGQFGPATQQACAACSAPDTTARYCTIREGLYRRFAKAPGQDKFLVGWLNRLNDLRATAGVPGFAKRGDTEVDFGETDFIEPIPDLAPDQPLENWR